jgi:chorismate mutase
MSSEPLLIAFNEALRGHRSELDVLDAELTSLLAKRFAVTAKIGELKAAHEIDATDLVREQAQLDRLTALGAAAGLGNDVTREVFSTIFRLVRENHRALAKGAIDRQ